MPLVHGHAGENHGDKENKESVEPPQILAPGYQALTFQAPEPGSYALPPIGEAADGEVLDSDGNTLYLHDLYRDRVTVMALVYHNCNDVNGCPLTELVLRQIQERFSDQPDFSHKVRIISLSFDPLRDTPETIKPLQKQVMNITSPQRHYLTTSGYETLDPILAGYQQSVIREPDESGKENVVISHVMRVFLIDSDARIRNIYSPAFLHTDTLESDIKTVLLNRTPMEETKPVSLADNPVGAGDHKEGYESSDYATESDALINRRGKAIDLVAHGNESRFGLPSLDSIGHGALDPEQVALGRRLFYERRLSLNDTISCAMCHIPEQGFTSQEIATAVGFEGRTVRRNAPTIINSVYLERLFHDGREFTLEHQIWAPLLASNEMANPSVGYVLQKIRNIPGYAEEFDAAFASPNAQGSGLTMENVGHALASYQKTLVAANTPFDLWRYNQDSKALSPEAERGYELFIGKGGCSSCHTIGEDYALFTDSGLHNTGIGYARSMFSPPEKSLVQIAPGVVIEVERSAYEAAAEPIPSDLGYYEVTQDPADRWKYRTPTLRNVALTAPYMHDGSLDTLLDVVAFYNNGGVANEGLDARIRPLGLNESEQQALVAFMEALTSAEVKTLIYDAFAAPIGDVRSD